MNQMGKHNLYNIHIPIHIPIYIYYTYTYTYTAIVKIVDMSRPHDVTLQRK